MCIRKTSWDKSPEVQEQERTSLPETMSFPPFSISIYSFPVH